MRWGGEAVLCTVESLAASLASTHRMPETPPFPNRDFKTCLQTLPNISWGAKLSLDAAPCGGRFSAEILSAPPSSHTHFLRKPLHTPAAVSPISSPREQALHQCVTSGDLSHLHENTWGVCETADSWAPSQPPCIRVPMGKIRFCFFPPKQRVASERMDRDLRPLEVKG